MLTCDVMNYLEDTQLKAVQQSMVGGISSLCLTFISDPKFLGYDCSIRKTCLPHPQVNETKAKNGQTELSLRQVNLHASCLVILVVS